MNKLIFFQIKILYFTCFSGKNSKTVVPKTTNDQKSTVHSRHKTIPFNF